MNPAPLPSFQNPARLAVLISGRGSNCAAIASAIRDGSLRGCEIAVVISNVPAAPGIEMLKGMGLPVVVLEGRGREQAEHEEAINTLLTKFRVDLICLAGYMRVLSANFVRQWKGRLLNIHPSLLPAFPGLNAQAKALAYGVKFAGCTVHFVDETVDGGVVILQHAVEVLDEDTEKTLSTRLLVEEHAAYPEAIRRVLSGEYEAQGRRYLRKDRKQ
jgi:phosphoribosylglycinamide formyltransferase-1